MKPGFAPRNKDIDKLDPTFSINYEKVLEDIGRLAALDKPKESHEISGTDRNNEVFKVSRNNQTFEVSIDSSVTLEDYERLTPHQDWELLKAYAEQLQGKSIVFINPTMEGGGVAMLRPPLVHTLKMLGVDAHWYVMDGQKDPDDPDPFLVTKKMHNISQRRNCPNERLTKSDKQIHWDWNKQNAEVLGMQDTIRNSDIIFIDDPQPAPLKRLLADHVDPKTRWLWRNHIDTHSGLMADPTTPQGEVASYLLDDCGISQVDAVLAHPVEQFVHPGMKQKTYFAPATTDPFDDLNRHLNKVEIQEGIAFINKEISLKNEELAVAGRHEDIQAEIDTNRKRIVLVARFDESKGMDMAMDLGIQVRNLMSKSGISNDVLPQVILVGNGSIDDPSGIPMYEEMLKLRRENYLDEKQNIIVMRLKHNYAAMNALMYPTGSTDGSDNAQVVGVQTSEAEGCETRISDWIRHGVPAVVFNNGGMPLQVIEGKSGYVMDFNKPEHDMQRGATIIANLMMDQDAYASLRATTETAGKEFNDREFTTTANITRILRVIARTIEGKKADDVWKISEMS